MQKDLLRLFIGFLVLLLSLLGFNLFLPSFFSPQEEQNIQRVETEEVIDGDTIRVKNLKTGEIFRIRYLGVDTPELEGPDYQTCFGYQAKEKNEELVANKRLILQFDKDKYDRFGRVLAYVFVEDENGEKGKFVNLELLKQGYARFFLDKQNTFYHSQFVRAANFAHDNFLGLWGVCGEDQFENKCVIKGNVDTRGHRYYHIPGDKYYSKTKVNLLKEDKWLCRFEEARAENFKRALREAYQAPQQINSLNQ